MKTLKIYNTLSAQIANESGEYATTAEEYANELFEALEQKAEDLLLISSLWSGISDPRILMLMLLQASVLLKKAYPGSTKVALLALNETSEKLAKKVFGFLQSATYVFSKDA